MEKHVQIMTTDVCISKKLANFDQRFVANRAAESPAVTN